MGRVVSGQPLPMPTWFWENLIPTNFAGGSITLHPDESIDALAAHVGDRLAMETTEAAWGVSEVVDENMANAARRARR